ncbi:MAG: aminoglycoside phosphotransferase family protein [Candidatus Nomurabacteria bacterium]|nr:aminoglycoside phosphotransferase family protein [Candidatus Nomurabacteria bacterium]
MIPKHNISSLEGKELEKAIKNDFGFEITNTEKITKGYSNQVYKGNLENKNVFIRMNKDPRVFEAEVLGYKRFEEQGIPVPKIIAYKENPSSIGLPAMIMSSAEGNIIPELKLSPEEKDIVFENVGKLLKKINETKLKGYGPLKVENGELVGKFSTYKEQDESRGEYNKKVFDFAVEKNYIIGEDIEKVKKVYEEISLLNIGNQTSLLHHDMHRGHFFVKGTEISGIIDLGALMAGDPRYDIAISLAHQHPREQEAFKKGYGELANDPMVNKYLITVLVRKIFFRNKDHVKGNVEALLPTLKDALEKLS